MKLGAREIVGIDIDESLIAKAREIVPNLYGFRSVVPFFAFAVLTEGKRQKKRCADRPAATCRF